MIPGADRITVAPVGRIAAAPAVEAVGDLRQQEFQRALSGQVGKSMQAAVLARLADGSFLVRVAGTPARMMLPSNPQPGTEVPLTLVALEPRPAFQLGTAPGSAAIPAFVDVDVAPHPDLPGAPAPAAAGAMRRAATLFADAPPAHQLPDADASASSSTISPAARMISGVLAAASRADRPQTAIVAPLPLLDAPPADPAKLGAALKGAIDASGLFYESHLAEWAAGQRPLSDLLREPQMQRALAPAAPGGQQADAAKTPAMADPAVAQFINLQLTSQEESRVQWQGQLSPGHEMAWQISRDAPERGRHGGADCEPPAPPWRSTLRLRFPGLGEIGATVVLAGEQLHIQLQPGRDDTGIALRARAGQLEQALAAAGATLASLTIGAGGHD